MLRMLRYALGLTHTVIESATIEDDRVVLDVRPWKSCGLRCPVCGRKCEHYDTSGAARLWRAIEVVTADGAKWVKTLVRRRCPNARWVMDPFHVVQWMTEALDEVRREEWREANKVKVTAKMGYGFRNTDNLIAFTMLRCSDMRPELPGRQPKPGKKLKQAEKKVA